MERKDLFKELIAEFHLRSLPDIIDRKIDIPIDSKKIITIIGPRRSGKTYTMFLLMRNILSQGIPIENIVYINFEDERLELSYLELGKILEAYKELYPNIELKDVFFFFDEIQNVDGYEKFIRRLYDNYSKNIFLTGSNSKLLSSEIATSLRGRTIKYEIFPLGFEEFLAFKSLKIEKRHLYTLEKRAIMKHYFDEYMEYGSFPEVILAKENLKLKILQEYFDVLLYKDIIERYQVKNHLVLKFFIKRVIENIGKSTSINNIYNELKSLGYKVSKDSLYEFMDMLQAVYFMFALKKYSISLLKSELSQKKFYSIDNGFITAITFKYKKDFGKLLENLIIRDIFSKYKDIFFFQNSKECDLILFKEDTKLPIQITYSLESPNTKEREIKSLLETMKYISVKEGFIITYDTSDTLKIDNYLIKIIPAFEFLIEGF